jgi:serine/threonine protein kinase/Tfp pilus assembly protein PilF
LPQLGRYRLIDRLAVGGMAEVFLAKTEGPAGFSKKVALKRILPTLTDSEEFVGMFLDEARLAAELSHPNVVQVFDFGQADGTYFLAMEFLNGEDAGRVIRAARKQSKPIPPSVAAWIAAEAGAGLHYAHRFEDDAGTHLNLIHRDVSPSNIVVTFQGAVKVLDFGIAKSASQVQRTQSGMMKGKHAYMCPEQIHGAELTPQADIWSLGAVIHEMLTDTRFFSRDGDLATLKAVISEEPPAPSTSRGDVSEDLDAIVSRCLQKDPAERYKTAAEVRIDLLEIAGAGAQDQLKAFMGVLFGADAAKKKAARFSSGSSYDGQPAQPVARPPQGSAKPKPGRDIEDLEHLDDLVTTGVVSAQEAEKARTMEGPPWALASRLVAAGCDRARVLGSFAIIAGFSPAPPALVEHPALVSLTPDELDVLREIPAVTLGMDADVVMIGVTSTAAAHRAAARPDVPPHRACLLLESEMARIESTSFIPDVVAPATDPFLKMLKERTAVITPELAQQARGAAAAEEQERAVELGMAAMEYDGRSLDLAGDGDIDDIPLTVDRDRAGVSAAELVAAAKRVHAEETAQAAGSARPPSSDGVHGTLDQLALPEIVQMLEFGRKSATVEVWPALGDPGRLGFVDGQLVFAERGTREPEQAWYSLARQRDGEFSIRYGARPARQNITGNTQFLLLEAMRLTDEESSHGGIAPAVPPSPLAAAAPAPAPPAVVAAAAAAPPVDPLAAGPRPITALVEAPSIEQLQAMARANAAGTGQWTLGNKLGDGDRTHTHEGEDPSGTSYIIKAFDDGGDELVAELQAALLRVKDKPLSKTIAPAMVGKLADGRPFVASDMMPGVPLATLLEDAGKPLPTAVVVGLLHQLLQALDELHQRSVAHLGLHPSNVIIDDAGDVWLSDVGTASRVIRFGEPARPSLDYMSPEQAEGSDARPPSDIYSLGTILYAALTGESPHGRADARATLAAVIDAARAPLFDANPAVHPALEKLFQRMCSRDPKGRATASELLTDIGPLAARVEEKLPRTLSAWARDAHGMTNMLHMQEAKLEITHANAWLEAQRGAAFPAARLGRAALLAPHDPTASKALSALLEQESWARTDQAAADIAELEKTLQSKPDAPAVLNRLYALHRGQGDLLRAADYLFRYLELKPDDSAAQQQLIAIVGDDPLVPFSDPPPAPDPGATPLTAIGLTKKLVPNPAAGSDEGEPAGAPAPAASVPVPLPEVPSSPAPARSPADASTPATSPVEALAAADEAPGDTDDTEDAQPRVRGSTAELQAPPPNRKPLYAAAAVLVVAAGVGAAILFKPEPPPPPPPPEPVKKVDPLTLPIAERQKHALAKAEHVARGGDHAQAARLFTDAMDLDPASELALQARFGRADMQNRLGDLEGASGTYEGLIRAFEAGDARKLRAEKLKAAVDARLEEQRKAERKERRKKRRRKPKPLAPTPAAKSAPPPTPAPSPAPAPAPSPTPP